MRPEVGGRIEDLPLPAGHERLANQLVDAIESELAAAWEWPPSARPQRSAPKLPSRPMEAAGGKEIQRRFDRFACRPSRHALPAEPLLIGKEPRSNALGSDQAGPVVTEPRLATGTRPTDRRRCSRTRRSRQRNRCTGRRAPSRHVPVVLGQARASARPSHREPDSAVGPGWPRRRWSGPRAMTTLHCLVDVKRLRSHETIRQHHGAARSQWDPLANATALTERLRRRGVAPRNPHQTTELGC